MVNNKSFAIISCLMALLIAMVCCFAFLVPKGNNNSASADTFDISYRGSSIVLPQTDNWVKRYGATSNYSFFRTVSLGLSFYVYNNSYGQSETNLFFNTLALSYLSNGYYSWKSSITDPGNYDTIYGSGFAISIADDTNVFTSVNLSAHRLVGNDSSGNYVTYLFSSGEFMYLRAYMSNSQYDYYYVPNMGLSYSGVFSGLPVSVMFGSRVVANQTYYHNFIRYYDSVDNYFEIFFIYWADEINNFPIRTYYFGNSPDYSAGYTAGQQAGYDSGLTEGQSIGYNNGYTTGYSAGDGAGYIRGVAEANNYSFIGLIGALVDAPIQAFTGLFNFEVFGVNMRSFFLSIMTLCIVLVVVRLILARKE